MPIAFATVAATLLNPLEVIHERVLHLDLSRELKPAW